MKHDCKLKYQESKAREVTFFMIVTNRDIFVADACIQSFRSLYRKYHKDLPFELLIYANGITTSLKEKFLSKWAYYPFVKCKAYDFDDQFKPGQLISCKDGTASKLIEGPYKPGAVIWDDELPLIETPYFCTIDADFEIFKPNFLFHMYMELKSNSALGGISSDFTPTQPYFDSYSNSQIIFHERWNTWCCMYRKEVNTCKASHFGRKVQHSDGEHSYDDAAYFQECVQKELGLKFTSLDDKWQKDFIHYGAFSKNRDLKGYIPTLIYRILARMKKNGINGRFQGPYLLPNILFKKAAAVIFSFLFGKSVKKRLVWDFSTNTLDKI